MPISRRPNTMDALRHWCPKAGNAGANPEKFRLTRGKVLEIPRFQTQIPNLKAFKPQSLILTPPVHFFENLCMLDFKIKHAQSNTNNIKTWVKPRLTTGIHNGIVETTSNFFFEEPAITGWTIIANDHLEGGKLIAAQCSSNNQADHRWSGTVQQRQAVGQSVAPGWALVCKR